MNNKFIKSTILLIIGGFITKLFSIFIKIILTRNLGMIGLSKYMLIMPTFNLFIVLAQNSFDISVSKLISEEKISSKKIVYASLYISFFISIILGIILYFTSPIISNLLHCNDLSFVIFSISFTLPFISISLIIRSYFFGKEKIWPHIISNIIEQLIRLLLFVFLLPYFRNISVINGILFVVLSNVISETSSIVILYFFLPKDIDFNYKKIEKEVFIDILNISLSSTSSRIIGTITYFFEPILLTNILLYKGFSINYINTEYGILTGYVFPLLLLPSFFSMSISQTSIPLITKAKKTKNNTYLKKKVYESIIFSLLIGLFFTINFIILGKELLFFLYKTKLGINYLKLCAPFFIMYYAEGPVNSIMQALGKSKSALITTINGSIIRILLLIILCYLKFGIYSLIISTIVNIYYITIINFLKIKKEINLS